MQKHLKILRRLTLSLAILNALWTLAYGALAAVILSDVQVLHFGSQTLRFAPMDLAGYVFVPLIWSAMLTMTILNWKAWRAYQRCERYKFVYTVALLNLLPLFSFFYIAGIPVGIVQLWALRRPRMRTIFATVQAGTPLETALVQDGAIDQDGTGIDVTGGWDESPRSKTSPDDRKP